MQFAVVIVGSLFAGKWLDTRFGTAPWLLIVGVFAGGGVALFAMYRKVFPSRHAKTRVGPNPPST